MQTIDFLNSISVLIILITACFGDDENSFMANETKLIGNYKSFILTY